MNAVLGSILENLRAISIVETQTVAVFKGDRTNTGDSKEISVKEFLEKYLPLDYRIKRGKIYSLTSESKNIDCVVLSPIHPLLTTPVREVILAEGVYAAVEVKPDISVLTVSSELMRGLLQVKTIKNLHREIAKLPASLSNRPNMPSYYDKIPSIIFSLKSADAEKTIDFINSKLADKTLLHDELPDMIVMLDRGILLYSPHVTHASYYGWLPDEHKPLLTDRVFTFLRLEKQEERLAYFLILFLSLVPPSVPIDSFILTKYLSSFSDDDLWLLNKNAL